MWFSQPRRINLSVRVDGSDQFRQVGPRVSGDAIPSMEDAVFMLRPLERVRFHIRGEVYVRLSGNGYDSNILQRDTLRVVAPLEGEIGEMVVEIIDNHTAWATMFNENVDASRIVEDGRLLVQPPGVFTRMYAGGVNGVGGGDPWLYVGFTPIRPGSVGSIEIMDHREFDHVAMARRIIQLQDDDDNGVRDMVLDDDAIDDVVDDGPAAVLVEYNGPLDVRVTPASCARESRKCHWR